MKLGLLTFGFLVACSGADPSIFEQPSPASSSDPVVVDDASAPVTLPIEASTCEGYAAPTTDGVCHACTGSNCQANGCFGGWYCKLDTLKCVAKPDGC